MAGAVIQSAEKDMFCTDCGKEIADDARFCPHCGVAATAANIASSRVPAQSPVEQVDVQRLAETSTRHHRFEKPEYVPHCRVKKTPKGFVVSFNTLNGFDLVGVFGIGGSIMFAIFGVYMIGLIGLYHYSLDTAVGHFEFVGLVAIGAIIFMALRRTRVEFTPRAIFIAGKTLDRAHFGSFFFSGKELAYQYGGRSFNFGGDWQKEREAVEVAAALNELLRISIELNGEVRSQPSAEELRKVRPTDF